jgi:hypothetical protein
MASDEDMEQPQGASQPLSSAQELRRRQLDEELSGLVVPPLPVSLVSGHSDSAEDLDSHA